METKGKLVYILDVVNGLLEKSKAFFDSTDEDAGDILTNLNASIAALRARFDALVIIDKEEV